MSHALTGLFDTRNLVASVRVVSQTYDSIVLSFEPNVISYWKFSNNGTDQQGVENATVSGNPELSIETIVDLDRVQEGAATDGLCIAWTGSFGEYAQAASNAAHKTAAGTIVVTFQRDTASERSTLVAADSNAAAGGLSVEVNTDGSPRAFLRNSGGTPVVITGLAGDAQLGQAYTMIFKWGTGGMSLSLWDALGNLVRRVTNPLADGVTGTSTIRFGAWHSDVSHHDGPFGRVVWMDRRITDAEEATLARARTIARSGTGSGETFPFVTSFAPAVNHTGMGTRPAYNAANPAATALTDPMSGLQIIRLGGDPGQTVFRYTAAGAAVNTGLVFPNCLRNPNTPTAFKAINSDGTLIYISEFFNVGAQPGGTLCRAYIIDVTGQYSGGVPWRIIRASGTNDFGEGNTAFQFWDETNPFRLFVKRNNGQIDAWYPIGTTGQNPAGPGTVNTWVAAPAAYNQFVARASDGNALGRDHDNVTTRDGRYHMAGCNRISDGLWGGIRVDLINQQYVNPFVASQAGQQATTRPTMRQIDSRTGRYCFQQAIGSGGNAQIGVDITNSTFLGTTPASYSHPCMIDVNGVDYIVGVYNNDNFTCLWNIAAGTNRVLAQVPQANPTHVTPLLGDRFELYGGTGSGATVGDRYVVQARSTGGGGGMRSIIAVRCGPNDLNQVRFLCDPRGPRTANHNECHPQAWFGGSRGFVLFPSSWNFQGGYSDSVVSPYVVVLPPGWQSPNNNGS